MNKRIYVWILLTIRISGHLSSIYPGDVAGASFSFQSSFLDLLDSFLCIEIERFAQPAAAVDPHCLGISVEGEDIEMHTMPGAAL